ncbi:MAG: glutamate racemase [Clostridia bacterium]|nr:glutamate racemase [Clostridia bacterium]
MKRIRRLGVFDSGLGGLTVLNEICKYNEGLEIVYFGDTARVPYGSRSDETILSYARQDVRFLMAQEVDAVVVACGTVSAIAIDRLQAEMDIPIFGVIPSAAKAAVESSRTKRIGLIGTAATVRSGAYKRTITQIEPRAEVVAEACPLLVPLIENGCKPDDELAELACKRYLEAFGGGRVDTIVMGCTHYPFYRRTFERLAPGVSFIDIGEALARELASLLPLAKGESTRVSYYVSDSDTGFGEIASRFLTVVEAKEVRPVNIEKY